MTGALVFFGAVLILVGAWLVSPAVGFLATGAWMVWMARRLEE